jgi:hypothetical protein
MGSAIEHTNLVEDILIYLGENAQEEGRFWKQATGAARAFDDPQKVISFGLKGSADITGILKNGKRIEIEIKTGHAEQSEQQIKFQTMINKFGGYYFLARDKESVLDFVKWAAERS